MTLRYLARSTVHTVRTKGLGETARLAREYVGARFFPPPTDETVRRFRLGQRLTQELGSTVAFGPFTGLRLDDSSWWGAADRGSMLLGFYEREVLEWLARACERRSTLVDLGAADGYYAVGCLTSGLVERAVAFEASDEGQAAIRANARANGVADRIEVRGVADPTFAASLSASSQVDFREAVVIIDIEGGEFDVLTSACIGSLAGAMIVVELHEWVEGAERGLQRIIADAEPDFEISFLTTGARDLSPFTILRDWPDDDRWILCSESRRHLMRWLVLTPKVEGGV